MIGGRHNEDLMKEANEIVTVFNTKGKKLKHGMTRSLAEHRVNCYVAKWIDKDKTKLQLLFEGRKPTIEEYAKLGEEHFGRKWR